MKRFLLLVILVIPVMAADPCNDPKYQELRAKDAKEMTVQEWEYFKSARDACQRSVYHRRTAGARAERARQRRIGRIVGTLAGFAFAGTCLAVGLAIESR